MGPQARQCLAAHRSRLCYRPQDRRIHQTRTALRREAPPSAVHLATEAVRTGQPVVDVEHSMTAFARSLGLETNGQQLRALKNQLARLAAATVRMGVVEEGRAFQINTQFVSAFDLWFPKQADQRVLWPSTVRLSEEYYQSLGRHAVPLDYRAIAALSSSSMALDVYVWLAQRLHRVPTGRPQLITWAALYD